MAENEAHDEDAEADEIDLLMLTAQEHDFDDEKKRVFASQHRPVSF